jgi:hypothetical protein
LNATTKVLSKRRLFVKILLFSLKTINPWKPKKETYQLSSGYVKELSFMPFKRFKELQTLLWLYCFPCVSLHEFSHLTLDYLIGFWDHPYGLGKQRRIRQFLITSSGPFSQVILFMCGISLGCRTPWGFYIITSNVISLLLWCKEDFWNLLIIAKLWKRMKIVYGYSKPVGKWYACIYDRKEEIPIDHFHMEYANTEKEILKEIEQLKQIWGTNIVERKDIDR